MKSEDTLKYKKKYNLHLFGFNQIKPIPIQIEENNKELESISVPVLASEQINKLLEEYGTKIKDLNTILLIKRMLVLVSSHNQIKINDLCEQINCIQRKNKVQTIKRKRRFL